MWNEECETCSRLHQGHAPYASAANRRSDVYLCHHQQEGVGPEYEAWQRREMERIARDREEREREAKEAAERERLKNMSEEERRQWERENPKARHPAHALCFQGVVLVGNMFAAVAGDGLTHCSRLPWLSLLSPLHGKAQLIDEALLCTMHSDQLLHKLLLAYATVMLL